MTMMTRSASNMRQNAPIYDLFGANVGGMIINGVPGHLTGVDLTSRIGMADFFLRMPEGQQGRQGLVA